MEILYVLIPMSAGILAFAVWVFLWAVRSGQFDDLEGPAHRILMDDDEPLPPPGKMPLIAEKKQGMPTPSPTTKQ